MLAQLVNFTNKCPFLERTTHTSSGTLLPYITYCIRLHTYTHTYTYVYAYIYIHHVIIALFICCLASQHAPSHRADLTQDLTKPTNKSHWKILATMEDFTNKWHLINKEKMENIVIKKMSKYGSCELFHKFAFSNIYQKYFSINYQL